MNRNKRRKNRVKDGTYQGFSPPHLIWKHFNPNHCHPFPTTTGRQSGLFSFKTRFQEDDRRKKGPALIEKENEVQNFLGGCWFLCPQRWRAARQLHACLGSPAWRERRVGIHVLQNGGLNISHCPTASHCILSWPTVRERPVYRDQTWIQAVCHVHFIIWCSSATPYRGCK